MFGHKKEKKTDRPLAAPGGDKLGVYIHIPFCKSKCDYCDFYSLAGREDQMDRYQKALLSHIAETAPMAQVPVDTIYFGGGTPSLYGEKRLKEILTALKKAAARGQGRGDHPGGQPRQRGPALSAAAAAGGL